MLINDKCPTRRQSSGQKLKLTSDVALRIVTSDPSDIVGETNRRAHDRRIAEIKKSGIVIIRNGQWEIP